MLRWDEVPETRHYFVARANGPDGPWSIRNVISTTAWMDTSVSYNRDYYYRVRAQYPNGQLTGYSEVARGMRRPWTFW